MRKIFVGAVVVAAMLLRPEVARAGTHLRLLLHGFHQIEGSPWGLSAWVLAPSVTDVPDKWVGVAGVRYNPKDWWLEVMTGAVIQGGKATPLIDLRAFYKGLAPVIFWTNWQWINYLEPDASTIYAYLMADVIVPWKAGGLGFNIGVETENFFPIHQPERLAFGPHIVIPLKPLAFVFALQFTNHASEELWLRITYNP